MATLGYLVNERRPTGLLVAQAVGITASAFLFGQNASMSYMGISTIMQAPAPLAAKQWLHTYNLGKKAGPILAIASAVGTGIVAYNQDPSSLPFKLNVAATVLIPSIIPFTIAFIAPTNRKLVEKANSLASRSLEDPATEAGVARSETTHALIDKWGTLNLARAGLVGLGAIFAVWAAVTGANTIG